MIHKEERTVFLFCFGIVLAIDKVQIKLCLEHNLHLEIQTERMDKRYYETTALGPQ